MPRNQGIFKPAKSARTLGNPHRHAGLGIKKTNRMKGWFLVLVVGRQPVSYLLTLLAKSAAER